MAYHIFPVWLCFFDIHGLTLKQNTWSWTFSLCLKVLDFLPSKNIRISFNLLLVSVLFYFSTDYFIWGVDSVPSPVKGVLFYWNNTIPSSCISLNIYCLWLTFQLKASFQICRPGPSSNSYFCDIQDKLRVLPSSQ